MKKKLLAITMTAILGTALLTGCAGSNQIDNDELTVEGYKGIEVTEVEKPGDVTDDDVEASIQSTLQAHMISTEITDRAVEEGDTINLDYVGKMDGEAFDGGSAEGASLEIGSGSFIDGFEDSAIGHEIGDTYDWEGSFPEEYQSEELAGQDVVFTITINSITQQEEPELTDDFVKEVSEESKTVEEYKKEVKEGLEKNNEETYKNNLMSAAWTAVLDKAEIKKYDDDKINEEVESYIKQYQEMAESYGMTYEELVQYYGAADEDEFKETLETQVKDNQKQEMVTNAIMEKEKLEPSEDELKDEYQRIADSYGYESVDALKEAADEDQLKMIAHNYIVVSWITDNCVQVADDSADDSSSESAE
ncbi:MAG: trigger factor [Suipraeoptans sp.]